MYVRLATIPYLTNKEEKLNTKMRQDKTYQMLRENTKHLQRKGLHRSKN